MAYCSYCMSELSGEFCTSCGKKAEQYIPAAHHLSSGCVLSKKYLVGAVIGEGGFGITYIGRDLNLDIKVAIKEYYPFGTVNRNSTSSTYVSANLGDAEAEFEKGKKSFLSEARTLAKFANEPNIVTVRDFFEENNTAYIVMDYLEGEDLRVHIEKNGVLSFSDAFSLLSPIMCTLKKIHSAGLIHRDISPSNIMIMKDKTVKLLDFGAARNAIGTDEKSLSVLLKPGFAPEEQYRTKGNQGPWTDVYALSATLYKMVTGITPDDAMNRLFSDEVKPPHLISEKISEAQSMAIMKGMAIYQKDRFQSIDELQSALLACENIRPEKSVTVKTLVSGDKTIDGSVYNKACEVTNPVVKPPKNEPQVKHTATTENEKKPYIWGLICSIIAGLIADFNIFNIISAMGDPAVESSSFVGDIISAIVFAALAIGCGYFYYPRVNNKAKKPRIVAFISSCVLIIAAIVLAFAGFTAFDSDLAQKGTGEAFLAIAVFLALPAIFLGYFYYPRLAKKKRKLFLKVYIGAAAAIVAGFAVFAVFSTASTVSIGDEKIKKDAETVRITADLLTDADIEELAKLKNLKELSLNACFLDDNDVKIIANLTQLEKLGLAGNTDIKDITPLKNLKELTYLDLELTGVEDISCLDKLTKLTKLSISETKVEDVSVLKDLTVLETLYMNNISSLDESTIDIPLTVNYFYCNNNGITNIAFLEDKIALSIVELSCNNLTDISPLSSKPLSQVDVSFNQITDISPISNVSADLRANNNKISDISSLDGTKANRIYLSDNSISDISVFENCDNLRELEIANNQIADVSALKDCFNIYNLNLSGNLITDISALATIDNLNILDLQDNQISDVSPLAQNENFVNTDNALFLQNNRIVDVTALSHFKNCDKMWLDNNEIQDVSSLKNCSSLKNLYIRNNNITDLSVLSGSVKLNTVLAVGNPVVNVRGLNLTSGDTVLGKSILSLSYTDEIDWTEVITLTVDDIRVYDIPPRQKDDMAALGYNTYFSTETAEAENE